MREKIQHEPASIAAPTEKSVKGGPGSRVIKHKLFDGLPGTSEGKAALLEFEMDGFDFIETPPAGTGTGTGTGTEAEAEAGCEDESCASSAASFVEAESEVVVEEQTCFDFGEEFREAPPTSKMLDTGALFSSSMMSASHEPDDIETNLQTDLQKAGAAEISTVEAQMDFEEAAQAIAMEEAAESMAVTMRLMPEAVTTASATKAESLRQENSVGQVNSIEIEEIELGNTQIAMVLDESVLPNTRVNTDSDLMNAITSIPEKMAFKIGEVADMIGVKQYVLRYWESEFDALKPRKSKSNQRVYSRRDVETAMMIKKLLYSDRFSIEGARAALKQLKNQVREEKQWRQLLASQEKVKAGLRSLVSEIRKIREALR